MFLRMASFPTIMINLTLNSCKIIERKIPAKWADLPLGLLGSRPVVPAAPSVSNIGHFNGYTHQLASPWSYNFPELTITSNTIFYALSIEIEQNKPVVLPLKTNEKYLIICNVINFYQISGDPWVSSDPSVPLWDMLPLVTREHLSEEDHAHIIQKMVAGSIATRETIIDCLDRNEYNHVTATYFLLAERKLRAQRHDTARKAKADRERKRGEKPAQHLNISPGKGLPGAALDSLLSPNEMSQAPQQPPPPQPPRVPSIKRNFNRMRQISIVEECEEEEEEDAEEEDVEVAAAMPARGLSRHSSTSSLADKPSGPSCSSPQLHLDLTLAFAAQRLQAEEDGGAVVATPAPFPQSSQIGTGLSRQNSLRRSGESTSGSSPCSERNETPGSPASPTNSSPAR